MATHNPQIAREAHGNLAPGGTVAAVGIIDIRSWPPNTQLLMTPTATAETMSITVSLDGGATYGTELLRVELISDATIATAMATGKTYRVPAFPGGDFLKVTKSGAVAASSLQYCMKA